MLKVLLLLGLVVACQPEKKASPMPEPEATTVAHDDFSDLKPKEETGCSTEEEQIKKLENIKPEDVKLQGAAASDCVVE